MKDYISSRERVKDELHLPSIADCILAGVAFVLCLFVIWIAFLKP